MGENFKVNIDSPLLSNDFNFYILVEEPCKKFHSNLNDFKFKLEEIYYSDNLLFVCTYVCEKLSQEFIKIYRISSEDYFELDKKPRLSSKTHFSLSLDEYFENFTNESNLEKIVENNQLIEE